MTRAEVTNRIKGLSPAQRRSVTCSLIGHSRIVTACFGYINCGRCGAQIADKLGGAGYAEAPNCVQVGHNCRDCRKNFRRMDWKDKFLTPNPFKKEKAAA